MKTPQTITLPTKRVVIMLLVLKSQNGPVMPSNSSAANPTNGFSKAINPHTNVKMASMIMRSKVVNPPKSSAAKDLVVDNVTVNVIK